MEYYGVKPLYKMLVKGVEKTLKDFVQNYPSNKIYNISVIIVDKMRVELTALDREIYDNVVGEYKALSQSLRIDSNYLG
ncbi:MAG: hypothetical protein QXL96_07045 [Ignisphaera sp.]